MSRRASLALALSAIVGVLLLIGGLTPTSLGQGPVRRDGPVLHAVGFALFVLPLVATWPRRWWLIVIGASLFGLAIEGLQSFTDRATEVSDILANGVGAVIGAGAGLVVARLSGTGAGRRGRDADL